jgi:anti-sigma regulatory factor (Ser/Thr protein kinase)
VAEHAFSLRADRHAPARARRALERLGEVDGALLSDALLLVSELVTNSVRHAGLEPRDAIDVTVGLCPGWLRAEVRDPGAGFEPEALQRAAGAEGGWGLRLVSQIAARWGVARGSGFTVWFELEG